MKLSRAARGALLLALVLVGLWPYLAELGRVPMTADGRLWLERGDPASEEWRDWVFRTRHFQVGYRPVAALSYTATLAARGVDLVFLRATDLALQAGAALALAALVGRLLGARAGAGGALAAFVFLAHPACEEVVPFLARRSYPLALVLVLAAALFLLRARAPRGAHAFLATVAAGILVFAALLSNEVAVVPLAGLLLLVLAGVREDGAGPLRARTLLVLGPVAGVGAALGVRQLVIGGLGGYEADADGVAAPLEALVRGGEALLGFEPRGVGLLGAIAVLALHGVAGRLGSRRERLQSLAFATWLVVGLALFAALGVWFDRLGHVLAPAWAALVALHLARGARAARAARGPRRVALAVVVGTLALSALLPLLRSPVLRGPDADRALKWSRRQAVVEALVAAVDALEDGARLQLVLPYSRFAEPVRPDAVDIEGGDEGPDEDGQPGARRSRKRLPRDARVPFRWLQFVRPESGVRYGEFVYVEEPDWRWAEPTTLGEADGDPAVFAPEGRALWTSGPPRPPASGAAHVQRLLVRGTDRRADWFVFIHRPEGGETIPITFE